MRPFGFVVLAILLCGSAHAETDRYSITPEEHAACDSDAISYCAAAYPSVERMLSCMKANLPKLSRVCSAAFTAGLRRRHIDL